MIDAETEDGFHRGKAAVRTDHHVHNDQMRMQVDVIGPTDAVHEQGCDHLARHLFRNAVMGLPAREQMVVDELGCFGDGTFKRFTHRKIKYTSTEKDFGALRGMSVAA